MFVLIDSIHFPVAKPMAAYAMSFTQYCFAYTSTHNDTQTVLLEQVCPPTTTNPRKKFFFQKGKLKAKTSSQLSQ